CLRSFQRFSQWCHVLLLYWLPFSYYKSRGDLKMTSTSLPLTNVGSDYTIVTKVVPAAEEQNSSQTQNQLQKFLKGEPKALGVVQIMTGVLTILFGIVLALPAQTISVFSGIVFWGSLFHISAGSLAVSASNKLNAGVVRAALSLNILSTIYAVIAIILHSKDLATRPTSRSCSYHDNSYECREHYLEDDRPKGISAVLLIFSLLQFAISVAVLTFACKATCNNKPTVNTVIVVPNPESGVPVVSSIPVYQAQL
ncbi:membrane-spanning 4-domains subfamily A member 4A-like, partial [Clarias magur]